MTTLIEPEPTFESDNHDFTTRYTICQAAFLCVTVGLFLRIADVGLHLIRISQIFHRGPLIIRDELFEHPAYQFLVKGLMAAAFVLGPYLLWGRWPHPVWKRRSGLLVILGLIGAALWVADNGKSLGFTGLGEDHRWVRMHLERGISWAQIALTALLAADFLAHVDRFREARGAQTILGFVAAGCCLWILYVIRQTDWENGWPLRQWLDPIGLIILSAYYLPLTISAIQSLVLNMICFRDAAQLVRDLRAEASDPGSGLESLRSRSEQDTP